MERIFFSYARADGEFAHKLARDLRTAGVSIWMDQLDIRPGEHWDTAIERALNQSPAVLLILSKHSVSSNNVLDEINYALEEGKRILPILMEDCSVPFRLRRLQRIDFSTDYAHGFDLCRTHIASVLDDASSAIETTSASPSDPVNESLTADAADPSDVRMVVYWHRMGLTESDAQQLAGDLADKGVKVVAHEHYSPDPPDAVFISADAPAGLVRYVLKYLGESVRYLFPLNYPDRECGARSRFSVSIGLRAAHNLDGRPGAAEPHRVYNADLQKLTEPGITQAEFKARLSSLAPPRG